MPFAISVIRGDSIEATGNFNVVKLQSLAPTLQVYTSNPRNTAVNIRGLGVQLLWKPSDALSVTLSGDYSWQNPECCGTVFVRTGLTQRALARQV